MKLPLKDLNVILFLIIALSCGTWACAPAGKAEKGKVEDKVTREVRIMLENYYADVKRDGLLAELKYRDSSDQFYWNLPGFETAINYDSIKTLLTRSATVFTTVDNKWDSLDITPLDDTRAHYKGHIHSVIIDTSGNENIILLYEEGLVVKKDGQWLLQSGKTMVK